jgi:hypothetical protein
LAVSISQQGGTQEVKDRALLLATGFNHGQDTFDKAAASIRLSTMGITPPDNGMTQRAFGVVVGWFKAGNRCKAPQVWISRQQAATRLGSCMCSVGWETITLMV